MYVFCGIIIPVNSQPHRGRKEPMGSIELRTLAGVEGLVSIAHDVDEPVVVYDGEDECLVAMRPAVFERILFDSDLLNSVNRESLHL